MTETDAGPDERRRQVAWLLAAVGLGGPMLVDGVTSLTGVSLGFDVALLGVAGGLLALVAGFVLLLSN